VAHMPVPHCNGLCRRGTHHALGSGLSTWKHRVEERVSAVCNAKVEGYLEWSIGWQKLELEDLG
jgi:hypothetical protein